MSLVLVPAVHRLVLSTATNSPLFLRQCGQKAAVGRVVDAGQMMRDVRMELFGDRANEWKLGSTDLNQSYNWIDDKKIHVSEREERKRIALKLQHMCIADITLSMVKRYQFLSQFLGKESLVVSGLGRKYLINSQLTRLLHDDVRHLRILDRVANSTSNNEDLNELKQRLQQNVDNIRKAFEEHAVSSISDIEADLSFKHMQMHERRFQKPGCLLSFLSQQLSAFSGRKVSRFQVRDRLEQHPFWRRCHTSVSNAQDMLLFLVKEKACSPSQILRGIYVVLYDKRLIAHSMTHISEAQWQHPRLMDLLLYDTERRFGRISSRDLFGSAVFATEVPEDATQQFLPYPHSLPSLTLLLQKGILRPDEE